MLNLTLIKNILIIAMASSIISTSLTQKLKEGTKSKKFMLLKNFIISMVIGVLFSLSFSDIKFPYYLWVGLFAFIGAQMIYEAFEDKIFDSFENIQKVIYIERGNKK